MSEPSSAPRNDRPPSSSSSKNYNMIPHHFTVWLVFVDLLIGLNFTYVMFSTPIYLSHHSYLTDCAAQGSQEGCSAANSNEDTSCLWNATTSSCYFSDNFDCSVYNNDSVRCSSDPAISELCFYRYVSSDSSSSSSSSSSNTRDGQCRHRSGWTELQIGLFAAFSIFGGIFGPFIMQNVANKIGFSFTVVICGGIALLSGILFSVAVELGQNFPMYIISKILSSVTSYSGAYLYPSILTTCKFLKVDQEEKTFHTRVMGTAISFTAVLESIYLYTDTPSLEGVHPRFPNTDTFASFADFKLKLQLYNLMQYLIAAGFVAFGIALYVFDNNDDAKNKNDNENTMKKKEVGDDQDQKMKSTEPTGSPSSSSLEIEQRAATENADDNKNTTAVTVIRQQAQQDTTKDCTLRWTGGLLMPLVLQLSGQTAINSFVPIIFADVISDPLLSQVIATIPMPFGAIFSFTVLQRYFTPMQIFIVCAYITSLSCVFLGIGVYLPTVTGEAKSAASVGLSLTGLVLFSLSFMAGPGTLIFSVMMEVYDSRKGWGEEEENEGEKENHANVQDVETNTEDTQQNNNNAIATTSSSSSSQLSRGVSVTGSWTGIIQFSFRLSFPVFVKNIYPDDVRVGRAIAFWLFALGAFFINTFFFLSQRARGKKDKLAPKSVVEMTDKCEEWCGCDEEDEDEDDG